MIYTKTGNKHGYFEEKLFKRLGSKFEQGAVFWYDQHDYVRSGVKFKDCLNDYAWEHLRSDPTSKIFLFYGDEYYNYLDLEDWAQTIRYQRVNPSQLYIMCVDENWAGWTVSQLSKMGVNGINIQAFNLLMNRVQPRPPTRVTRKFSMFSRNYNKWRLQIYVELFKKNLLKHFDYTFNNINPYGQMIVYSVDTIKQDCESLGYEIDADLNKWIEGMPYTVENDGIQEKLSLDIYNKILASGINVVIESHFDPFWNFLGHRGEIDPRDFSPAFPTEKIYKAVGCSRPFIIFSTPFFLQEFKQLGYKTFHPYIDESYDSIVDDKERLKAIANEIERISNLPENEFKNLITKCEEIAKHNVTVMLKLKTDVEFKENFKWAVPLVHTNIVIAPGGENIWG